MVKTPRNHLLSGPSSFWGAWILGLSLLATLAGHASEVTLAWDANTEPDINGYRIHHGSGSRAYSETLDVGNVTTTTIEVSLEQGASRYIAVTAYNTAGLESDFSEEVIYVAPVSNQPPVAGNLALSVPVGGAASFTLPASDPNDDALFFAITTGPEHGKLSGDAPNLVYTPDEGYAGQDEFVYSVNDGELTATATVSLEVGELDDPPGPSRKLDVQVLPGGAIALRFQMNLGESFEIQRSGDLLEWVHVGFGVAEGMNVEFIVEPVAGQPAGFFRVINSAAQ